jgi:hypothetical protein
MDQSTFNRKPLQAEIMFDIDGRPNYWLGFICGLKRAFYGDAFSTEQEHQSWLSLADGDDQRVQERGSGYRDGLQAT